MKLPLCLFSWDRIVIPKGTDDWRKPEQRLLITDLIGKGTFCALGMHCSFHGIWFGFIVDDEPFVAIHNAACIKAMGLIGVAGVGMPAWLPIYNSDTDLCIAYSHSIPFNKRLQLYMGSSSTQEQGVKALHVYFDADLKEIRFENKYLQPSWVKS